MRSKLTKLAATAVIMAGEVFAVSVLERVTSDAEYNYDIDTTLLKQDEFPPDTFDGEKLLEVAEIIAN